MTKKMARNRFARSDDKRRLDERLLEILRTGGRRKVSILRAWASWAGYRLEQFDVIVRVLKLHNVVVESAPSGEHYLEVTT